MAKRSTHLMPKRLLMGGKGSILHGKGKGFGMKGGGFALKSNYRGKTRARKR
jgi:hypothetical protein